MKKEEIIDWLKAHNIKNYFIYDDLTVDVDGNIDLANSNLEIIPIQFHVIKGYFDCSGNKLISLKGCPKYIDGSFYCNNNQLLNLEGGPETVTEHYDCNDNALISLKGLAKNIGKDFTCGNNKLTKLEYLPHEIKGNLSIDNNQLTSLEGCSQIIAQNFSCNNNNLTSLEYAPKTIGNYLFCHNNNIESIMELNSKFSKFLHSGSVIHELAQYYKPNNKGELFIDENYNIIGSILSFHKLNEKIANKKVEVKGKNKI